MFEQEDELSVMVAGRPREAWRVQPRIIGGEAKQSCLALAAVSKVTCYVEWLERGAQVGPYCTSMHDPHVNDTVPSLPFCKLPRARRQGESVSLLPRF